MQGSFEKKRNDNPAGKVKKRRTAQTIRVYVQGLLQGVLQRPWIRYTGAYWIFLYTAYASRNHEDTMRRLTKTHIYKPGDPEVLTQP